MVETSNMTEILSFKPFHIRQRVKMGITCINIIIYYKYKMAKISYKYTTRETLSLTPNTNLMNFLG